jgi:hypothetical protein
MTKKERNYMVALIISFLMLGIYPGFFIRNDIGRGITVLAMFTTILLISYKKQTLKSVLMGDITGFIIGMLAGGIFNMWSNTGVF